jgi:hypothetical protein
MYFTFLRQKLKLDSISDNFQRKIWLIYACRCKLKSRTHIYKIEKHYSNDRMEQYCAVTYMYI